MENHIAQVRARVCRGSVQRSSWIFPGLPSLKLLLDSGKVTMNNIISLGAGKRGSRSSVSVLGTIGLTQNQIDLWITTLAVKFGLVRKCWLSSLQTSSSEDLRRQLVKLVDYGETFRAVLGEFCSTVCCGQWSAMISDPLWLVVSNGLQCSVVHCRRWSTVVNGPPQQLLRRAFCFCALRVRAALTSFTFSLFY